MELCAAFPAVDGELVSVLLESTGGMEGEEEAGLRAALYSLQELSGSTRDELANYPGGNGDHTTAISLLGATLGALFHKERTGEGQMVRFQGNISMILRDCRCFSVHFGRIFGEWRR